MLHNYGENHWLAPGPRRVRERGPPLLVLTCAASHRVRHLWLWWLTWRCGLGIVVWHGAGGRRALYGDLPGIASLPPQDFAQAEGYMVRRLAFVTTSVPLQSPPRSMASGEGVSGHGIAMILSQMILYDCPPSCAPLCPAGGDGHYHGGHGAESRRLRAHAGNK